MTYLTTLTKLNTLAAKNPAAFVSFWLALCQFHNKATSFGIIASQFIGTERPEAIAAHNSTPEEQAEEAKLDIILGDGKTPASGINYHKTLTWLSTVDIGDAVLAKVANA